MQFYVIEPTTKVVVGYYGTVSERKRFAMKGEVVTLTQKALDELEPDTYKVLASPLESKPKKKSKKKA